MVIPAISHLICLLTFFQSKHFYMRLTWDHEICEARKTSETLLTLEIAKRGLQELCSRIIGNHAYGHFVRYSELRVLKPVYKLDFTDATVSQKLSLNCNFLRNYCYTRAVINYTGSRLTGHINPTLLLKKEVMQALDLDPRLPWSRLILERCSRFLSTRLVTASNVLLS